MAPAEIGGKAKPTTIRRPAELPEEQRLNAVANRITRENALLGAVSRGDDDVITWGVPGARPEHRDLSRRARPAASGESGRPRKSNESHDLCPSRQAVRLSQRAHHRDRRVRLAERELPIASALRGLTEEAECTLRQ